MRTALAIRHVAFEDLGVLEPTLRGRGYAVEMVDAGVGELSVAQLVAPDLLMVLGGPIGVQDEQDYPILGTELAGLARRLEARRATLGVCLGAQLMARALGADVRSTGRKEIGYSQLTLTEAGLASPLAELRNTPVLHWHGDEFLIPDGAQRLAETPGFPNQAFGVGSWALGLQFHLEADHARIERWLIGHAVELAAAGIDVRQIRADAAKFGPKLAQAASRVFNRWLDGLSAD